MTIKHLNVELKNHVILSLKKDYPKLEHISSKKENFEQLHIHIMNTGCVAYTTIVQSNSCRAILTTISGSPIGEHLFRQSLAAAFNFKRMMNKWKSSFWLEFKIQIVDLIKAMFYQINNNLIRKWAF